VSGPARAGSAPPRSEQLARAWLVALVAAWVPPVWFLVTFGDLSLLVLPAVLASAWLWFLVARELERIAAPFTRLLAAAALGLVSPPLGVLLSSVCGMCSCCGVAPFAAPSLLALMFQQPLWFFPWGLGMGLVAFVLVGAGRRLPPQPPPNAS
jgi:hypothetical protein